MRKLFHVTVGLFLAGLAGFAVALVVAVVLAVLELFLAGHGVELPGFTLDYRFIHLSLGDLVLLSLSFVVALTTFFAYLKSRQTRRVPARKRRRR